MKKLILILSLLFTSTTFANHKHILHIALKKDWIKALKTGEYTHPTLAEEGFIHASTEKQLVFVANTFFKGKKDLLLIKLNPKRLHSVLKMDYVQDLDQYFPHIYGTINVDAAAVIMRYRPNKDGVFEVPAIFR